MTDIENQSNGSAEIVADDRDSIIADLKKQVEAVNSKNKELLAEKKSVSNKAKEAELEKAKRDGDYEQLLKSSESHRTQLETELNTLKTQISNEKLSNKAMAIASELADGVNAKLLSKFIQERLSYVDGEIKVLDTSGNLSVATLENLKSEFQKSDDYKSLLRGSKASGGNSMGNTNGVSNSKVIARKQFEKMSPVEQMAHVKSGGQITDDV